MVINAQEVLSLVDSKTGNCLKQNIVSMCPSENGAKTFHYDGNYLTLETPLN